MHVRPTESRSTDGALANGHGHHGLVAASEGSSNDADFPTTTARLLRRAAVRFPHLLAIVDGDVSLSFPALEAAVRKAARALIAREIRHGDRVAIWAPNLAEWVIAALAIHCVGGVLVPINTRFKRDEAAYLLKKSGARCLFTVSGFLGADYPSMLWGLDLPDLETIVVLRGDAGRDVEWNTFLSSGGSVPDEVVEVRLRHVLPGDVSDILFTSGTTGKPKGVMATHGQTVRAFRAWSETVALKPGDRYLVVVPFFHSFGYKAGFLAALMAGACVHPLSVFDVDAVLERVSRERITVLPGPPALYQSLLAHPRLGAYDLSSLRLAVTGAAVIPVELVERMRSELGFETVITAYGLTEATGVTTMCRADDDPKTIAETSGRAIDGVEVRIVDEHGDELPRGAPGEVVVRGYTVMKGYWDDAAETLRAIDRHGFLHTGDVGVMDDRGNLRITDRKKDMFIVGGFNAYPAEIEQSLLQHPLIAHVAVVGAPDERLGEVGVAFVVLRAEATLDEATLIAWCRERMANYKVPRRVAFASALPTNASGKVLKFELRERALALRETRSTKG